MPLSSLISYILFFEALIAFSWSFSSSSYANWSRSVDLLFAPRDLKAILFLRESILLVPLDFLLIGHRLQRFLLIDIVFSDNWNHNLSPP
jgi:hypothetical protein